MKVKVIIFILCSLFFMNTTLSNAKRENAWEPKRYLGTTSLPITYQDNFKAESRRGLLTIKTEPDRLPGTTLNSVEGHVNELYFLGHFNFNKDISRLDELIDMTDINSIRVALNGKLDSYLLTQDVSSDSFTGTYIEEAHEVRSVEDSTIEIESPPMTIQSLVLSCNSVELNTSIPFPSATVTMQGNFFIIRGQAAWLPPDPGSTGKDTIAGIDSDEDCVRDDIELYIARKFPNIDQDTLRMHLYEYAVWMGIFLMEDITVDTAKEASNNMAAAGECAGKILGSYSITKEVIDDLFAEFHNTYSRSIRYIDNMSKLGGWTTREILTITCQ